MLALQTHDPNSSSLPERVTGMAARFIARRSRSKVVSLHNTPPMVSFTFDDVPASACEVGARILERHGARGTFYVSGAGCGTSSPDGSVRASIDQLRTVWANGHEIGCHTFSHPAIRHMSLEDIGTELERNRSTLKEVNSSLVLRNFAYPYGDLSIRTKRYLEGCFDSCRSGHAGINAGVADLGGLDSWPLQNATLDRARIAQLIVETVQKRGWLIFFSHDVATPPSAYGVSPDLLEWTVGTANRAGCVLTTIADGLDLIRGNSIEDQKAQIVPEPQRMPLE
jgi:peptidoglycan/xylan/chitin deacetylase (PgdA/CDA1 family)